MATTVHHMMARDSVAKQAKAFFSTKGTVLVQPLFAALADTTELTRYAACSGHAKSTRPTT